MRFEVFRFDLGETSALITAGLNSNLLYFNLGVNGKQKGTRSNAGPLYVLQL